MAQSRKPFRQLLFGVIIAGLAIGGYYAYRMFSDRTPDLGGAKPDAQIGANDLLAAFDRDTAAAAALYLDKVLEITGRVHSTDTSGAVVMGEEGSQSVVRFGLDRRHLTELGSLKPGSMATLQGRCTGYEKGEEMMGLSLGTTVTVSFAAVKTK